MEWYDMIVFNDCKKYSVKGPKRKTGLVKSVFRGLGVERGCVRPETENYKNIGSRGLAKSLFIGCPKCGRALSET